MNAIDKVRKIERLATTLEKYRANWLPQVEKIAVQVRNEILRLRTFAASQSGYVADHCRETAAQIEAELQSALDKFEVS